MKILTGKFKGRLIKMPKGIRPTQQKVRKAIFDILRERIDGAYFLELYAGSGAVGIEALSCGAAWVDFVERDKRNLRLIKENLASLKIDSFGLHAFDSDSSIEFFARQQKKFDIIFLDPPYHKGVAKKTLQTLSACDILAPNGFIIVQHFKKDDLPEALGDLVFLKQYRYGDTFLALYKRG